MVSEPQRRSGVSADGRAMRIDEIGPSMFVDSTSVICIAGSDGTPILGVQFAGHGPDGKLGKTPVFMMAATDGPVMADSIVEQAAKAMQFDGLTAELIEEIADRRIVCLGGCGRQLFGERKVLGYCTTCDVTVPDE